MPSLKYKKTETQTKLIQKNKTWEKRGNATEKNYNTSLTREDTASKEIRGSYEKGIIRRQNDTGN